MSETEKFMQWYNEQKAQGLIDVRFVADWANCSNAEEFFKEVNMAIAAYPATTKGEME